MATQGTSVSSTSHNQTHLTLEQQNKGTSLAFSFPPYGWKVRQLEKKKEELTSLKKRNKKKNKPSSLPPLKVRHA